MGRYRLFDLLNLLVILITLATGAITVVSWLKGVEPAFTFLYYFTCAAILIVAAFAVHRFQSLSSARLARLSEDFHKFTHFMRDEHHHLRHLCTDHALSKDLLDREMTSSGQEIVDLIEDSLTAASRAEFCVCIKYLAKPVPANMRDARFATLCRSKNTPHERINDTLRFAEVKQNTHLIKLVIEGRPHFVKQNLVKYSKKQDHESEPSYVNSNPKWKEHYRACVAVPIRMQKSLTLSGKDDEEGFDVIGILCADTMSTSAISRSEIKAYANLLQAYADTCYTFFDACLSFQERLKHSGGKNEVVESVDDIPI